MVARLSTRTLLRAGVIGPVLFVVIFLVEGATRPGYDPVLTFVSQLSLGEGGWLQIASFVVTGALMVAFAAGLGRAWGSSQGRLVPRLVGLVGVSLAVCGAFVTDPALGYPAGAPAGLPTETSWHAAIHYLGAVGVFLGLPAAAAVAARRAQEARHRSWAAYSLLSGAVMLVGWLLTFAFRGSDGTLAVAGLLQRIAIVGGFQWIVATALIELRRTAPARVLAYA